MSDDAKPQKPKGRHEVLADLKNEVYHATEEIQRIDESMFWSRTDRERVRDLAREIVRLCDEHAKLDAMEVA
jgi:hypothetical protein